MPAGRPTDYGQDILDKAQEYVESWQELFPDDVIPTIEGLALHLGIARSTVYDWATHEEKKEFSDIVATVLSIQGRNLVNKGLKGEYNPTIAKLMLSGKHDYTEKTDLTSGGERIEGVVINVKKDET